MSINYLEFFYTFPTEDEYLSQVKDLKDRISEGFDVNEQDLNGDTHLHKHVKGNFYPDVRVFCESGADVNIKDNKGVSPLSTAIENRKYGDTLSWASHIISMLIKHGADVSDMAVEDLKRNEG